MKNLNLFLIIILVFSTNLLLAQTSTFNYTGSIETYIVPTGVGSIQIFAEGAEGGNGNHISSGIAGKGANMQGKFVVTPGQVLKILVGEQGEGAQYVGGGGGGSFVWDEATGERLIIAGGGGGGGSTDGSDTYIDGIDAVVTTGGTNGAGFTDGAGSFGNGGVIPTAIYYASGGAGWNSVGNDGTDEGCDNLSTSGQIPLLGGAGGSGGGTATSAADGGFGGGSGGNGRCNAVGGGGGGGYSGGGAGGEIIEGDYNGGGGGGSLNLGTNKVEVVGVGIGNGQVIITTLCLNLSVSASDSAICLGDELTLSASSPFTNNLTWDLGVVNNVSFTPSAAGTIIYTVTSDNSNDCPVSQEIIIHDSIGITGNITYDNNDMGAIDITVSSDGNNYTYDWNTDESGDFDDSEDVSSLSSGNYTVIVKNDFSCVNTKSFVVDNSVGIKDVYFEKVNIYPNPANSILNIEFPYDFTYKVVSIEGKILLKGNASNKISVNIESLSNNVYYLILNANDKIAKSIFIIE